MMKLRALAPLVFFGLSLFAGTANAQLRRPAPPPRLPAALGWPHSLATGNGSGCARDPGPNEVIVFKDEGFRGACAALPPGFYPYSSNFLVGNDAISSVKVGSNVRLRAFKDGGYAGEWTVYPPSTQTGGLGPMNDVISSLRVEPGNRSMTCNDLVEGEIALFEGWTFTGDCVVLPGDGGYPTADSMGIANDSISSINNNSGKTLQAFWNASFNMLGLRMPAHSKNEALNGSHHWNEAGIDDHISSIQMM